jgi:hypothetical protein
MVFRTKQLAAVALAIASVALLSAGEAVATSANNGQWLTTRSVVAKQLPGRFKDINSTACSPDRTSNTQVFGTTRYWNRFWCTGATYDHFKFRVRYEATGQCGECWTITHLTGVTSTHLRVRHSPTIHSASTSSSSSGSCGAGYYRNSYGHCVLRPTTNPPDPAGATAICADGSYSYSEHASGTCSHHGGVARWINHP